MIQGHQYNFFSQSNYLKLLVLVILLGFFWGTSQEVFAVSERQIQGSLLTEFSPDTPGPYTLTTVALTSLSQNLAQSIITWSVNGEQTLSGINARRLSFKTLGPGEKTVVQVRATSPDGKEAIKELTFNPGDIDLLWEANSSVPPPTCCWRR